MLDSKTTFANHIERIIPSKTEMQRRNELLNHAKSLPMAQKVVKLKQGFSRDYEAMKKEIAKKKQKTNAT